MLEWMFWEQYSHEPSVAVARFQVRYLGKSPDSLGPDLFRRAEAALDRLDSALDGVDWLVGDRFSLADMALAPYTRFVPEAGLDLGAWPRLKSWIARFESRLGLPALGAA